MTFEAITVEVAKLTLAPGDVVVIKSTYKLPDDVCRRIAEHVSAALPGNKVLVLIPPLELSVLTKADIEARL